MPDMIAGHGRARPMEGEDSVGQWIKYLLQSQCLPAYCTMFRTCVWLVGNVMVRIMS
jgi:hypothetical protein